MMMMMMKNPITLVICTLLFSSLAVLANEGSFGPDECCFKFSKRLRKDSVVNYNYTDEECTIKSVIFTMKNGAKICADASHQWVKNIIKAKDKLRTL